MHICKSQSCQVAGISAKQRCWKVEFYGINLPAQSFAYRISKDFATPYGTGCPVWTGMSVHEKQQTETIEAATVTGTL